MILDKIPSVTPKFLDCNSTELNINTVLLNGQSFRWKISSSDEINTKRKIYFLGVAFGRVWKLWRKNQKLIGFQVLHKFSSATGDDKEVLEDYFQLHVSLRHLYAVWSARDLHFIQAVSANQKTLTGVRVLAQDAFETVLSFICSSNNNIQRISKMVETLCGLYGESVTFQKENMTFYDLPDLQKMVDDEQLETKLRKNGFGYRSTYLYKAVHKLVEFGGKKWLSSLASMQYEIAKKELEMIPGVGPKVADCICLMGLHMNSVVPVDTHILQLTKAWYRPELPNKKAISRGTYTDISATWREIFGEYAGWAHSVLFSTEIRHFKSALSSRKRSGFTSSSFRLLTRSPLTNFREIKMTKEGQKAKPIFAMFEDCKIIATLKPGGEVQTPEGVALVGILHYPIRA